MEDIYKYVTHFEKKDYPVEDFYLIHTTSLNTLGKILKVGKILPISKTRAESRWWDSDMGKRYKNQVFTSLGYPFNDERMNFVRPFTNDCHILLKPEIITEEDHFCYKWRGGELTNNQCTKSSLKNKKLNLHKTLNKWRRFDYKKSLEDIEEEDDEILYNSVEGKFNLFLEYKTPTKENIEHFLAKRITSSLQAPYNEVPLLRPEGVDMSNCIAIQLDKPNKIADVLIKKYPDYNWIYNID